MSSLVHAVDSEFFWRQNERGQSYNTYLLTYLLTLQNRKYNNDLVDAIDGSLWTARAA